MKNGYFTKLSLSFLLCLLASLAGCDIQIGGSSWPRVESQRTEQLSAGLEADSTLEIETSRGSISITGADVADCSITATIKAWADSKEEAEQLAQQGIQQY